jgi:hypothetical protein
VLVYTTIPGDTRAGSKQTNRTVLGTPLEDAWHAARTLRRQLHSTPGVFVDPTLMSRDADLITADGRDSLGKTTEIRLIFGAGWVEGVRQMSPRMARISVRAEWVSVLDFETRFPSATEAAMSGR